jgi:hypothetical protein
MTIDAPHRLSGMALAILHIDKFAESLDSGHEGGF